MVGRRRPSPRDASLPLALEGDSIAPARVTVPGVQYVGKSGRRLKHPRADWITTPEAFGLPTFETEHQFHPVRKWRFDYAWPFAQVALEIDGGSGGYGRHSRPGGMRADHSKINTATLMGWRVLRVLAGEESRLSTLNMLLEALQ